MAIYFFAVYFVQNTLYNAFFLGFAKLLFCGKLFGGTLLLCLWREFNFIVYNLFLNLTYRLLFGIPYRYSFSASWYNSFGVAGWRYCFGTGAHKIRRWWAFIKIFFDVLCVAFNIFFASLHFT